MNIRPNIIEVEGQASIDNGRTGMCLDMDIGHYLVIVKTENRNITQIYKTVAHELVHVKQYMYDNLGHLLDQYKPPYEDRWWEKEAELKSEELILRFVHSFG